MTPRGGAVVARWAHNPKVVGSSPAPATKLMPTFKSAFLLLWKSYTKTITSSSSISVQEK